MKIHEIFHEISYRVQFFETDAMGVVHHSNYVRMMETARVSWLRELGMMELHLPNGPLVLAVTSLALEYLKPVRFDDDLRVRVQGCLKGSELITQYAIWCERMGSYSALGKVHLVPLNAETLKLTRFSLEWREKLRKQPFSERWPEL